MDKKMSKEQAEKLADELLAQQPRQRDAGLAKTLGKLFELRPLRYEFNRTPYVPPAAAWGVMYRDTHVSNNVDAMKLNFGDLAHVHARLSR